MNQVQNVPDNVAISCRDLTPLLRTYHNEKMYEFASGLYFLAADADMSETEFPVYGKNREKLCRKKQVYLMTTEGLQAFSRRTVYAEMFFKTLEPLRSVNYVGESFEFPRGWYFVERDTSTIEFSVYDLTFKKLCVGWNSVLLVTTKGKKWFDRKKLYAYKRAENECVWICDKTSVVPRYKNLPPCSEIASYMVETPLMRDTIIAANNAFICNIQEPWKQMRQWPIFGNREETDNDRITRETIETYEMNCHTQQFRKIKDWRTGGPGKVCDIPARGRIPLSRMINGKVKTTNVNTLRMFLSTFRREDIREHHTQVDHINGIHTDNSFKNARPVGHDENNLMKISHTFPTGHAATCHPPSLAESLARDLTKGNEKFEKLSYIEDDIEKGWMIGSHGTFISIRTNQQSFAHPGGDVRKIYPSICFNGKNYMRHHIVVFCHERTKYKWDTIEDFLEFLKDGKRLIEHKPPYDKNDYRLSNLEISDASGNQTSRQNNPITTTRKRVLALRPETEEVVYIFESRTEATKMFGVSGGAVSSAVHFNATAGIYRKTTDKKNGKTYILVCDNKIKIKETVKEIRLSSLLAAASASMAASWR